MPDAQSRWFYIVRQLQVAGKLSTKVAGNHLLLSVTRRSERCRSGSEVPGARLYERQGAERRSGGVEGRRIRDELRSLHAAIPAHQVRNSHRIRRKFAILGQFSPIYCRISYSLSSISTVYLYY